MNASQDKRYKNRRWKATRLVVLNRDGWRCWVTSCPERANVADHIEPVYVGMSDALFYGTHNLRASCQRHNTARGVAARLEQDTAGGIAPAPRRYSYGGTRAVVARPAAPQRREGRSRFLETRAVYDWRSSNLYTQAGSATVTADYSRREPDDGAG